MTHQERAKKLLAKFRDKELALEVCSIVIKSIQDLGLTDMQKTFEKKHWEWTKKEIEKESSVGISIEEKVERILIYLRSRAIPHFNMNTECQQFVSPVLRLSEVEIILQAMLVPSVDNDAVFEFFKTYKIPEK